MNEIIHADLLSGAWREGNLLDLMTVQSVPFPKLEDWYVWPGVDSKTPIPSAVITQTSGIWTAPAPRSRGLITIDLHAKNIRPWRYFGMSKNGYGSPGRPEGNWDGCPPTGDCNNGQCSFYGNPDYRAASPGLFIASYPFENHSHDYPRYCSWAIIYTKE